LEILLCLADAIKRISFLWRSVFALVNWWDEESVHVILSSEGKESQGQCRNSCTFFNGGQFSQRPDVAGDLAVAPGRLAYASVKV
jgi:hypothetical protein